VSINVKLCAININTNNSLRPNSYWTERREWWRANKARLGTDWAGINQTQIEVADYLASLRKRGAA
jgi:hypothetical protein